MIRFHYHPTPNPLKVALALEEMGLAYEVVPVDTFKGEQHDAAFRAINPNGKVPAIEDGDVTVFDSNAILLYLAERSGQFMPADGPARGAALSWLMFVATGLSPFSGQAVHFLRMAPEDLPYAKNRYLREVERHYSVLDGRLGQSEWLAGDDYSVADMAAWGWAQFAPYIFGDAGLSAYPNVERMRDAISARPAAAKALAIKDGLSFKSEMDEETKRAMFPSNYAA